MVGRLFDLGRGQKVRSVTLTDTTFHIRKKGNRVVRFSIDIRPLTGTIVDVAKVDGVTNLRPIHGH